jgi:hypothetical protein
MVSWGMRGVYGEAKRQAEFGLPFRIAFSSGQIGSTFQDSNDVKVGDKRQTMKRALCFKIRRTAAVLLLGAVTLTCAHIPTESTTRDTDDGTGAWYPQRHPEAAFREIDDEEGGLVVLPSKAEVKVLNPVGIRVFSLIDGTRTPEDVARAVIEEFDVDYETALSDVYDFLSELEDSGMLAQPIPDDVRGRVD